MSLYTTLKIGIEKNFFWFIILNRIRVFSSLPPCGLKGSKNTIDYQINIKLRLIILIVYPMATFWFDRVNLLEIIFQILSFCVWNYSFFKLKINGLNYVKDLRFQNQSFSSLCLFFLKFTHRRLFDDLCLFDSLEFILSSTFIR